VSVVQRGQQVPGRAIGRARSAQCLAIHRDQPPSAPGRSGTLPGPGAGRGIQGISVQVVQGPPEGGLARHHAADPERIPGALVCVGGPFGDRGERAGAGQHRAYRQAQDRCQLVPDPAAGPRIRDRGQHRQQPRTVTARGLCCGKQLANRGVGQG
jgi:hypothetical protein